jgi:putative transposase
MYDWHKLSGRERMDMVTYRRQLGFPIHAPPHFPVSRKLYLISAACFEHGRFMLDEDRRDAFATLLVARLSQNAGADIRAWAVMPDHYHVLLAASLERVGETLRLLHSGTATQWSREDGAPRRKVWFRFSDRAIRGDRHYWSSVNYIHTNPVKHGWVNKADEWKQSSLCDYLKQHGRDRMVKLWKEYPVLDYGEGWDD